jgi:hypothetical protein
VSRFLTAAEEIFATAGAAAGEDCDWMLLVDGGGAVRAMSGGGWSLEGLREHHGASAVYRVQRSGGRVLLEGSTGARRCVLESGRAPRLPISPGCDLPQYRLLPA